MLQSESDTRWLSASGSCFEIDQAPFFFLNPLDLLLDQGDDVTVIDFFFLIGQFLEFIEDRLDLFSAQSVAECAGPIGQGRSSTMFTQYEIGFGDADIFGAHDLIGAWFFQHPVLVNACFVGECIASHDRFVPLDLHAGDGSEESTGWYQALAVDLGCTLVEILSRAHGHDNFFQAAIASPFSDSIDSAFDLPSSLPNGFQAICNGHPQVIMAMNA